MLNVHNNGREGLVRVLVQNGVIGFSKNPNTPMICNFGTTFLGGQRGPITPQLMRQIGECLSDAAAHLCSDCQGVMNVVPHEAYVRGSAFADPLVYAFAQRGIMPMRLHQIRQQTTAGESTRILVVDTYAGDAMRSAVKTLCGMPVDIRGAVFLRREDDENALDEGSLVSIYTRRSLAQCCLEHGLVPPHCRSTLANHLQKAA